MVAPWVKAVQEKPVTQSKDNELKPSKADLGLDNLKVAVLDSSAFIHGFSCQSQGVESAVTVEEVLGTLSEG